MRLDIVCIPKADAACCSIQRLDCESHSMSIEGVEDSCHAGGDIFMGCKPKGCCGSSKKEKAEKKEEKKEKKSCCGG
jgi:hypothetical protein